MATLFHGAHTKHITHDGQCFTDELSIALDYAQAGGVVAVVEVDLVGEVEVAGYSADDDFAPGDDGGDYGAEVIRFADISESGASHTTWRVMSGASSRVDVVAVVSAQWVHELVYAGVSVDDWVRVVDLWVDAGADADDFTTYDGDLEAYKEEDQLS